MVHVVVTAGTESTGGMGGIDSSYVVLIISIIVDTQIV